MTELTQDVTLEVSFLFKARGEQSDYIVDHSPVWQEVVDEEFLGMFLDGVTYDYDDLVKRFGQHGADALIQVGRANIEEENWGE